PISAVHEYTSSARKSNTSCIEYMQPSKYPAEVCSTPLGFPVVPLVYKMYSGCSESNDSAPHSAEAAFSRSCHQRSRPSCQATFSSVRLTTTDFSMVAISERGIGRFFQWNDFPSAKTSVRGDEYFRFCVRDSIG